MNQNPDLYNKMDIVLPTNAVPFQERFNDFVGGVALDCNFVVFTDINACDYYEPEPSPSPEPSPEPTPTPTPTPVPVLYKIQLSNCISGQIVYCNSPVDMPTAYGWTVLTDTNVCGYNENSYGPTDDLNLPLAVGYWQDGASCNCNQ